MGHTGTYFLPLMWIPGPGNLWRGSVSQEDAVKHSQERVWGAGGGVQGRAMYFEIIRIVCNVKETPICLIKPQKDSFIGRTLASKS